jgi:hypothetical protein
LDLGKGRAGAAKHRSFPGRGDRPGRRAAG